MGVGMISIFDGAGGCLDYRLSSTSGVMSHNMSSEATVRTAAGTAKVILGCIYSVLKISSLLGVS